MLTVEERHALILQFEQAITVLRTAPAGTNRLDVAIARVIATDTVQRDFYQVLNSCTDWGAHPAGGVL